MRMIRSRKDEEVEETKKGDEEEVGFAGYSKHRSNGGKIVNRGAWTVEEDRKLAEAIEINGPKRWKIIANKAAINRCGKSCRLRWMNYLRPNIKRGGISDQEEDLILRLHKLLGNRWSLIAGRLPGRTDNEIKNYWNSRLSKKIEQARDHVKEDINGGSSSSETVLRLDPNTQINKIEESLKADESETSVFDADDFFDFSNEDPSNLEWLRRFISL